jgi:hypothetical protein
MGCEACRQSEPEANFPLINLEVKSNDRQNETSSEKKHNYDNFTLLFEDKLQNFGKYFEQEFNTLITPEILAYMTENPFSLNPEQYEISEVYEMKPIEFNNGNVYKGGWNENLKMEGQGKYYLKEDGVLAEGLWKEGNLVYARVFIGKEDSFDIYEGEMKNSSFYGKGKLILSNGVIYEGDFIDGEKTGNGKIIFEDKTVYEGGVEKGDLNGKGKMIWTNGYEYEGDFGFNKLCGNGILKSPNGEIYEGEFKNNLFNGYGKYTFKNGNTYEGQFLYGVKKGKGVYKCLNKFEYDGDWDNDLPCGVGKLSDWNKTGVIKSTWRYGNIMEEPVYEQGTSENFEDIDLNIVPDQITLNIKDLSNLDYTDMQSTQFKLGTQVSFLDE